MSFSGKLIVERLIQALAEMLFVSKDKQKQIIQNLQSMEPGDVRVGETAAKMIEKVSDGGDPLPLLAELISSIEGGGAPELASGDSETSLSDLREYWSTAELAEIFGCSLSTMKRWLAGGRQSAHNKRRTSLIWEAIKTLGPEEGCRWVQEARLAEWKGGEAPRLSETAS
jgi:hypothetical protein